MKTIKNLSVQGLEVYVKTPKGPETVWLEPRKSITIPENYVSSQIEQLAIRRMVRVF